MAIPASGVNRWLTLNGEPLIFDPKTDNLSAGAKEYSGNRLRLTRAAPDGLEIRVDGEPLETEVYGRWTWRPSGFAGLYEIQLLAPRDQVYRTQVRVLPSHISQQRHEWMLQDIANFSADLLFQLRSPAEERVSTGDIAQHQSPLRTFRLIEPLLEELETAMAHIARMPHRALVSKNERRQLHEVFEFSSEVAPIPGPALAIATPQQGSPAVWPQQWQVGRSILTYDVYENRLLKQFLWRQLLTRLDDLETRARGEIARRESNRVVKLKQGWEDDETARIIELEGVVESCRDMQRRVISWGSLPFLRDVRLRTQRTVSTQVLQKYPAYGRFYQTYLRFQRELRRGLHADGYLTRIAMRKMSELYEIWSVLRLTQLLIFLLDKFGFKPVSSQGFYRVDDELFHFEVDRSAEIVLSKQRTRVVIRYEPTYPPMDTIPHGLVTARRYQRTPDLAVEVYEEGVAKEVMIFDAKYRAEKIGGRETYMDKDLQKMSSYYGEIVWKERDPRRRPRRVVASAYILYPGEVIEHNADYVEVGALPFMPGPSQQEAVNYALVDLLRNAGLV